MSITNHNEPHDLRQGRRPGPSNQYEPTRPLVSDSDERPRSVPVGSLQPEGVISTVTEVLRQFNHGDISKGLAVARITFALGLTDERDANKERDLQNYLEQVDQIERVQQRIPSASSQTAHTRREAGLATSHSSSPLSTVHPLSDAGEGRHRKRPFQFDPDDSDGPSDAGGGSNASDDSGSDDRTPDRKRAKLRESDMPWYEEEKKGGTGGGQRESCQRSRELLRKFGRDIRKCKEWILTSASAPAGFPPSEWENLLRGKPVNLDVVFSSLYQMVPVKENKGRIGEKEISFGHTEPARKVQAHGDWTIAWNIASRATEFLFPHRRLELAQYSQFIQAEFSTRRPETHQRVLYFDQAIRHTVAGGTQILLSDIDQFAGHRSAILSTEGVFFNELGRSSGPKKGESGEVCRRFNTELGCPNATNACRHRHVCQQCGESGHGEAACERKN